MKYKALILSILGAIGCLSTHAAEKPNILFIFSDDQCYETIGALGMVDIDTPNLDRLVKGGTTFTKTYNMGAWGGAVCVASRTCLNTGAFLWQAQSALDEAKKGERKMWGQLMSDAGYTTYLTGKWHVQYPAAQSFEKTANIRAGMPKSNKRAYNRPTKGEDPNKAWLPWDTKQGGFWKGGKHWSEVLADDAVGFIDEATKDEKPFFMYLAFNAPHDPRQSPKEYVDRYPLSRIKTPQSYQDLYPDMGQNGIPKIRDENLAPYPRTEYAVKVHRQEYFALITHMDTQIGRILDALEKSGKAENTWIIFTSDHGLAVGHHGLIGKQNMYEHSLRPPFIIKGPGVKAGVKIDAPIYLQDAMATSLELSGQKIPASVDYKSVIPLLNGSKKQSYDKIFGAYMNTQRAIISDGWKLISYPKLNKQKLFKLADDPQEMKDLANDPEHSNKLKELTNLLKETMLEMKDPIVSAKPIKKKKNK